MSNDWNEYQKLVLAELERLSEGLEKVNDLIVDLRSDLIKEINETEKLLTELTNENKVEISMLKVKSGIWGLMGGLIPAILMLIVVVMKGD